MTPSFSKSWTHCDKKSIWTHELKDKKVMLSSILCWKIFCLDWINFSWSSLPWFSSVPRCTNYFLGVRSESMTLLRCQSKRKTGFPVIICRALPSLRTENHFPLQLALELRGRSLTILTRLCKVHTYYGNMGWGLFKQGVKN